MPFDVGQFIINFLNTNGMAGLVLAALFWFLARNVWPFFTKEVWPAAQKRADARDTMERALRDNVIEIKGAIEKMTALILANDQYARADRLNLAGMVQQASASRASDSRAILETVSALHVRLTDAQLPLAPMPKVEREISRVTEVPKDVGIDKKDTV